MIPPNPEARRGVRYIFGISLKPLYRNTTKIESNKVQILDNQILGKVRASTNTEGNKSFSEVLQSDNSLVIEYNGKSIKLYKDTANRIPTLNKGKIDCFIEYDNVPLFRNAIFKEMDKAEEFAKQRIVSRLSFRALSKDLCRLLLELNNKAALIAFECETKYIFILLSKKMPAFKNFLESPLAILVCDRKEYYLWTHKITSLAIQSVPIIDLPLISDLKDSITLKGEELENKAKLLNEEQRINELSVGIKDIKGQLKVNSIEEENVNDNTGYNVVRRIRELVRRYAKKVKRMNKKKDRRRLNSVTHNVPKSNIEEVVEDRQILQSGRERR